VSADIGMLGGGFFAPRLDFAGPGGCRRGLQFRIRLPCYGAHRGRFRPSKPSDASEQAGTGGGVHFGHNAKIGVHDGRARRKGTSRRFAVSVTRRRSLSRRGLILGGPPPDTSPMKAGVGFVWDPIPGVGSLRCATEGWERESRWDSACGERGRVVARSEGTPGHKGHE